MNFIEKLLDMTSIIILEVSYAVHLSLLRGQHFRIRFVLSCLYLIFFLFRQRLKGKEDFTQQHGNNSAQTVLDLISDSLLNDF